MSEEQLRKELDEAKQLIKLLKEEVGFAERGYTQKGWVKSYCGGKPNYCTPEEVFDVDAVNMSQERVDETAKGEHKVCYEIPDWKPGMVFPSPKKKWVGLTDEDLVDCESEEDVQFVKRIEAKLKEKNGG